MTDNMYFTEDCNPTLKAQAQKILPALNAVSYGRVVVDAQVCIVGANDNYLAFIGKDFNAIANKPMRKINAGTHLPTVVRSGEPEYLYLLTYDGNKETINWRHCIASSIPLRDEEANTVIGAVGIVVFTDTDITRLRPLLEGIEKQQNKEAAKWRAIHRFEHIKGNNATLQKAKDLANRAADRDCAILITGETGTGKELFAHAIHNASYRNRAYFVPLNVAGISRERLEEEIFGVPAYAESRMAGKLQLANRGTLFLDEVGELPLPAQALLLRVLEEKTVAKIGADLKSAVDVRIISTTRLDLQTMVKDGSFLDALYFRLNGMMITLPPLRKRLEDLLPLCEHLLPRFGKDRKVDRDALRVLRAHSWPGNVRELCHVLERVCIYHDKPKLTATEFGSVLPGGPGIKELPSRSLEEAIQETERTEINCALCATSGNVAEAAEKLGITARTLYNKISGLGISIPSRS